MELDAAKVTPASQPSAPPPAYGGPSQVMNANQSVNVTVVNQPTTGGPTGNGYPQRVAGWSTGICGCFENCTICLAGTFCFPCHSCYVAYTVDENICGPCCWGQLFTTALRTKVRTIYGIRGSILDDCCCMAYCSCLAMMQMHRELNHHGYHK